MGNCVFCKIASGEFSIMRVYEDENTLAFMDNAKDVGGHVLDCDNQTLCEVMTTVKKVSNHLTDNCGYDGVDLLCANDESARQSLLHFHVHIIPRRRNDGLGGKAERSCFPGAKYEIAEIFDKIKM